MTDWRWDSNLEYWLRLAHQRYNQEINQVLAKHSPLTERYWPVLQTLLVEQGIHQISICERTGEPGYQTSRVLDKLERLGFVTRRSDPMNHRARLVYLTEKGEALRVPLAAAMQGLQKRWLDDMGQAFKSAADDQNVSMNFAHLEGLKTLFTAWLRPLPYAHSGSYFTSKDPASSYSVSEQVATEDA